MVVLLLHQHQCSVRVHHISGNIRRIINYINIPVLRRHRVVLQRVDQILTLQQESLPMCLWMSR